MKKRLLVAAGIGFVIAAALTGLGRHWDHPASRELKLQDEIQSCRRQEQKLAAALSAGEPGHYDETKYLAVAAADSKAQQEILALEHQRRRAGSCAGWFQAWTFQLSLLILVAGLIWPGSRPLSLKQAEPQR